MKAARGMPAAFGVRALRPRSTRRGRKHGHGLPQRPIRADYLPRLLFVSVESPCLDGKPLQVSPPALRS